jgi:hypothetical protein
MIEIVVLSQLDCRFCDLAEQVLKRVGRDYPLEVRHIRLDSEQGQALAARHGVLFAPGILLGGQLLSYGRLSERRLRRHLDRHLSGRPASQTPAPHQVASDTPPRRVPDADRTR